MPPGDRPKRKDHPAFFPTATGAGCSKCGVKALADKYPRLPPIAFATTSPRACKKIPVRPPLMAALGPGEGKLWWLREHFPNTR